MDPIDAHKVHELQERYMETTTPLKKLAKTYGMSYVTAHKYIAMRFSVEERKARKNRTHSNSTRGVPTGRSGVKHPLYKGGEYKQKFKTSKTPYTMVIKPMWYTGAKNTRYVPKHVLVVCEALGISELPKGFVVHHCDCNHMNNEFNNLVLVPKSEHNRIHLVFLESVTTMADKASTLKWLVEARGFAWKTWATTNADKVSYRANDEIV